MPRTTTYQGWEISVCARDGTWLSKGDYGCSLPCAEDYGYAENLNDYGAGEIEVPADVVEFAQEFELEDYQ